MAKRRHIVIEADSVAMPQMSGIGHFTASVITELHRRVAAGAAIKLTLIVPFGSKQFIRRQFDWPQARLRSLPPGYRYWNYALSNYSLPLFPDLWYGRGSYIFPNYKVWRLARSPAYMYAHDIGFRVVADTVHEKTQPYMERNFGRWIGLAKTVFTISQASAAELREHFPETAGKLHVTPLAAAYPPRQVDQAEIAALKKRYGLPPSYILFVGNIEPRKNLVTLLQAFTALPKAVKAANPLVIVGGGGWRNEAVLQAMAGDPAIVRPGRFIADSDMPALYAGARLLVHPAIHEGFGMTPLEAMQYGTPALVSDIPVMHEVCGAAAAYVSPYDAAAFGGTLERLLGDQAELDGLARAGSLRATKFSWQATVDGMMHTIEGKK